jgi:hypothetical protein
MPAADWDTVFDQMWTQLDALPPRKLPPTAEQWARQFTVNRNTLVNAVARNAQPLLLMWRQRKRFWYDQVAEDMRAGTCKTMAELAQRYHVTPKTMRGVIANQRKKGKVDPSTRLLGPVDWDALARDVNEYLDRLEKNERPMERMSWATIFDIDWDRLAGRAKRYPDESWAKAINRHRSLDAAWRESFVEAVERNKGRRGYVSDLARDFHITYQQADSLVCNARLSGLIPRANRPRVTAARILDVATPGMTRRQLAAAAGISLHCLEAYLRGDKRSRVTTELRQRLVWQPRIGPRPSTILAIRSEP